VTIKFQLKKTLSARQTNVTASLFVFREEFHNNPDKQPQWSAFLKKTRLTIVEKGFREVMRLITDFLKLVLISIVDKLPMENLWNSGKEFWDGFTGD
jgi:hypothetical protein